MNILHVIALYNGIKANMNACNRGFVSHESRRWCRDRSSTVERQLPAGNLIAKQIIRLITSVGEIVNNDPIVGDKMKVVFLDSYRALMAEKIIPAADLSEQISTAGTEASGI
ncbi:hypothetical protein Q1695_007377 [Nippostrongylus brasiliensis]|nr:hypothetical protein Q1695_007377 [Nippostrongylus brasiliensis]